MLTLMIGPDWIANRNAVLRCISEDVQGKKGGRILIVPELISHETERKLCAEAGDTCSRFAEVLSFTRLAKRVADFDRVPLKPCLDNGGRLVAMASATKQLRSKLKAYAAVETRPEFFTGLIDAVDEFKRCCISPEDLKAASLKTEGSLAQKLEELSLILESYDSVCARGKCDPRDQMAWLLEELEESQYGSVHTFYIDGFPDFTRQHMNILQHLALVSENVTVSLTCDKIGSGALAFEKAGQTAAELLRFAQQEGIAVQVLNIAPRENILNPVKQVLLEGDFSQTYCDSVKARQTQTLRLECEYALEEILSLISLNDQDVRYRDINVVCGNLGAYRNTLEMIFQKCGIPFYVSGTESILEQPAITTVFAALNVALGGFEQQDVLHYLKTMMSPLNLDTCDRVENYAVIWNIQGKEWTEAWKHHPKGLGKEWDERAWETLNALNEIREKTISPLVTLKKDLHDAATLGEEVMALYRFLDTIAYDKRLAAKANVLEAQGYGAEAQVLNQLWDILVTALEQLYDVLGDTVWEAENFTRLLKLLISQYSVGTIPTVLDAVSIGPVSAMRCQTCEHLIVLGAEDSSFPGRIGTSGVLSDQERTALRFLGVPLTGGAMDGLLAEFSDVYGVFNSAEKTIYISSSGSTPSFIFRRLAQISGGVLSNEECLGTALANAAETSAYLLRKGDSVTPGKIHITEEFKQIQKACNHSLGTISPENVEKLYGDQLQLSASQIDKLAACRLGYFFRYGLCADERRIAEVNPAEFGSYVHAVLENSFKEVMTLGGFKKVEKEQMLNIVRKHSDDYATQRFSVLTSEREQYLFLRNWQELELVATDLWEEMQHSEFTPSGFEVAFGKEEDIPSIDVSGKNMKAYLRGYIDRVDTWSDGKEEFFRIVDYKTGGKDFSYCDVYNGYGLQMLLYLFALEDSKTDTSGNQSIPAGVQYVHAGAPYAAAPGMLSDELARDLHKKTRKRNGLILKEQDVLQAMEASDKPQWTDYQLKKGEIAGTVADRRQFSLLKKYVFRKVGKLVDEIASGTVAPNPYTTGNTDACRFCPYGSVCHKLTVEGRRNYQATPADRFWEDVEKEVGNNG